MFLAVLENQKVERYIHEFKKRNFYPILVWNLINASFKHSFKELKKTRSTSERFPFWLKIQNLLSKMSICSIHSVRESIIKRKKKCVDEYDSMTNEKTIKRSRQKHFSICFRVFPPPVMETEIFNPFFFAWLARTNTGCSPNSKVKYFSFRPSNRTSWCGGWQRIRNTVNGAGKLFKRSRNTVAFQEASLDFIMFTWSILRRTTCNRATSSPRRSRYHDFYRYSFDF